MHPTTEIRLVAAEYGLDAEAQIAIARPFCEDYLEFVFADDSFEIVTGGYGCAAELARASGLGVAAEAFLATDRRFGGAMLGLKIAVGSPAPATLYHRALTPLSNARVHLAALCHGTSELLGALRDSETLYGFGFSEASAGLRIKTYVLSDCGQGLGFRSVRLGPAGVEEDVRLYTPEAHSNCLAAAHARRALGVTRFGHVAHSTARQTKVYVERVGAIATDYSAL